MNIFVVSQHERKCARALDDKRLNKMILETAQIICTVLNLQAGKQVTPYKNCQPHHPIVKWAIANKSKGSLAFLYALGIAYGEEIQYRFGRKHACHLLLEGLTFKFEYDLDIPEFMYELEFYNGARHKKLGLDYTHLPVPRSYREYLKARWKLDIRQPKWTKRRPPTWR